MATLIETFTGKNGSWENGTTGLKWEITSGNSAGYFSLNSATGQFYKEAAFIPVGTYVLGIRLYDAASESGELLVNGSGLYESKHVTCTSITITVIE